MALAAVGRVHAQCGATTLVVSGVMDPGRVEFFREAVADFELALVRLAVDEAVPRRRMEARGVHAEDMSGVLSEARRHDAARDELPVVRADRGSPSETARRVLDVAPTHPTASSRTEALAASPRRGVLVDDQPRVGGLVLRLVRVTAR